MFIKSSLVAALKQSIKLNRSKRAVIQLTWCARGITVTSFVGDSTVSRLVTSTYQGEHDTCEINASVLLAAVELVIAGNLTLRLMGNQLIVNEARDLTVVINGYNQRVESPTARAQTVKIVESDLYNALTMIKPVMAKNDVRYYLNGALLEFNSVDTLSIVATDGHRLNKTTIPVAGCNTGNYIIDHSTVSALLKVLRKKSSEVIYITLDKIYVKIEVGGVVVNCKLADGTYPDYKRVIPSDFNVHIDFSVGGVVGALKSLIALNGAAKCDHVGVRFKQGADAGILSVGGINVAITGDTLSHEFIANAQYLIDAIKAIDASVVTLNISASLNNICFTAPSCDSIAMVMPMRG